MLRRYGGKIVELWMGALGFCYHGNPNVVVGGGFALFQRAREVTANLISPLTRLTCLHCYRHGSLLGQRLR